MLYVTDELSTTQLFRKHMIVHKPTPAPQIFLCFTLLSDDNTAVTLQSAFNCLRVVDDPFSFCSSIVRCYLRLLTRSVSILSKSS